MRPVHLAQRLTVLKAGQGVGKTEQGLRAVAASGKAILLTHRRTLAADLLQRFNRLEPSEPAQHYLEVDLSSTEASLVIVVNSLPRLDVAHYKGATVYIDEVTQLLDSLQGEIFDDRRARVLDAMRKLLSSAAHVVVADKDVDQSHVDLLASWMDLVPDDIHVAVNEYVLGGPGAHFHTTLDTWLAALSESASGGRRLFVASDERSKVEAIAEALKQRGLRTLTVVADDGSPERDQVLQDINLAVKDIDALLVSPALFTGVDITDEQFGDVFLLATGATGAIKSTDFMQAVHRVRRPTGSVHVWVGDKSPETEATPRAVAATMDSLPLLALLNFRDRDFIRAVWAYRNYYVRSAVARNRDVSALRARLEDEMEAAGHPIYRVGDPHEEVQYAISDAASEIITIVPHKAYGGRWRPKADVIGDILDAVRRLREANEAGRFVLDVSVPQRTSAEYLARYFYRLNGHSWDGLEDIIWNPDPQVLERQIENFEAATLPRHVIAQRVERQRTLSLGLQKEDLSGRAAMLRDLLEALGGDFRRDQPTSEDDQLRILDVLRQHKWTLSHSFGQSVPTPQRVMVTLRRLLKKLGLEVDSSRPGSGNDRMRIYSLNPDRAKIMYGLIERRRSRTGTDAEPASPAGKVERAGVHIFGPL